MKKPPLIEYQNITVCRGERVVLESISLSIETGEHVAILGPNGSGKSTLIKTFTRECYPLLRADSSLRMLGRDTWNVFEMRAMLGIVTNDLMSSVTREFDFTGREIVLSGFFGSVGLWPYYEVLPHMQKKAGEVMEMLEITHLGDRQVAGMSSGEARRVVIARALVNEPKALVLDEPTTSLDFRAMHELREFMRKVANAGTSILLVTHHLPDIIPEIGRVILLQNGRIVGDGPKNEILTSGALSKLFEMEVDIEEHNGYYHIW
jgi:iron complex transport system ATP-binding protein